MEPLTKKYRKSLVTPRQDYRRVTNEVNAILENLQQPSTSAESSTDELLPSSPYRDPSLEPNCSILEDEQLQNGNTSDSGTSNSVHSLNEFNETRYSSSNSTVSDVSVDEPFPEIRPTLSKQIGVWSLNHNITFKAQQELIEILNSNFGNILPKDPRTIKGTPAARNLIEIGTGHYYHFGLLEGLTQKLRSGLRDTKCNTINFCTYIGGLP